MMKIFKKKPKKKQDKCQTRQGGIITVIINQRDNYNNDSDKLA